MKKYWKVAILVALCISSVLLTGCGRKTPKLKSRLEYLEESVIEKEQYLKEAEAKYKEDYALAKKNGDKEQMDYLKAANEVRLKNEKKMLLMEQKELEKMRASEGK